jgi:hypothetical protein
MIFSNNRHPVPSDSEVGGCRQGCAKFGIGTPGAVNVSPPPPALLNVVPPGYRLRLPGPAAVPERVRAALARPVLNHRGPEFHAVLAQVAAGLRRIFGTRRDVFVFGSSGTGAMEAALANVLGAGDDVLVHAPPAGAGVAVAARMLAQ